jgi:hypothetical protein
MERVILVCREPGDHGHTVYLIEEMFPECTVEIVAPADNDLYPMNDPFENIGSHFQIVPFLENY